MFRLEIKVYYYISKKFRVFLNLAKRDLMHHKYTSCVTKRDLMHHKYCMYCLHNLF